MDNNSKTIRSASCRVSTFHGRPHGRTRWHEGPRIRWDLLVSATWTFDDGVVVGYSDNTEERERYRKSRVFVDAREFDVVEDLTNRTRRPYDAWRAPVVEALARIGVTGKLGWSQKAGCAMCPCSPGFIVTGGPTGGDFWVRLPGAPTVDGTKPARELEVVL